MTAVAVTADATFEAGAPTALFQLNLTTSPTGVRNSYDVTADGQRFLVNSVPDQSSSKLIATLNWPDAIKR